MCQISSLGLNTFTSAEKKEIENKYNVGEGKMKKILLVLSLVVLLSSVSHAAVVYDDGEVHIIDFFLYDSLFVINSDTGEPTTANIIDGGYVYSDSHVHGDSEITIDGGSVASDLFTYDSSSLNITGGVVHQLTISNNSRAIITGGSIQYRLFVYNDAIVEIYDGSIGEIGRDLYASNNAKVFIYGGTIGGHLESNNYAEVSISGGSIDYDLIADDDSQVIISGGYIGRSLITHHDSQVVIIGTNFNYPLGYISNTTGTLTGTLANGDPIDVEFIREGNGAILLTSPKTADLFLDGSVNLQDFAIFASYWADTECALQNNCEGADFEPDGDVDIEDLVEFSRQWLE